MAGLTNNDFRLLMMTPRADGPPSYFGAPAPRRKKAAAAEDDDEEHRRRVKKQQRPKPKAEGDDEGAGAGYRDRAAERRNQKDTDHPEGEQMANLENLTEEQTKFLGGDMEHTHLVKGLDYSLLEKKRAEIEREAAEAEKKKELEQRLTGGITGDPSQFVTAMGRRVHQLLLAPKAAAALGTAQQRQAARQRTADLFARGRMTYVFDLEGDVRSRAFRDLPSTVVHSKAESDALADGGVVLTRADLLIFDKVCKIMAQRRDGTSRAAAPAAASSEAAPAFLVPKDEFAKPAGAGAAAAPAGGPAPMEADDEGDIFPGAGSLDNFQSEALQQAPDAKGPTFVQPVSDEEEEAESEEQRRRQVAMFIAKAQVIAREDDKNEDEDEDEDDGEGRKAGSSAHQRDDVPARSSFARPQQLKTDIDPAMRRFLQRDDSSVLQKRKVDEKEKETTFVSDLYAECYPGSFESAFRERAAGVKKTAEELAAEKEAEEKTKRKRKRGEKDEKKEKKPKTEKQRDAKLNRDLVKVEEIMKKKAAKARGEAVDDDDDNGGGGDDGGGVYYSDEDESSSKRSRH
eukprot:m51a1_g11948 putative protein red (571) ;mRNA; r:747203-749408